jgi:hypothetical protein
MLSPLYGQLSPLRVPTSMRFISNDADVLAYVLAVEAADGQRLEDGVISAYDSFITGCKSDGIWNAIKASCILAGARTLNGALIPLVGTAPTNNNFVSADYNRKTGLKGNGTTKSLNSNRNNNSDPQNNKHLAVFMSEIGTGALIGANTLNQIFELSPLFYPRLNSSSSVTAAYSVGLIGASRSNSTSLNYRLNSSTNSTSASNSIPASGSVFVFSRASANTAARLSFYSIGESIDLAKLDFRVSTFMTAFSAAIP